VGGVPAAGVFALVYNGVEPAFNPAVEADVEGEAHVSANERELTVASMSRDLLEGVRSLLLSFGIHGSIRPRQNGSFGLRISGTDFVTYVGKIGFVPHRKHQAAAASAAPPANTTTDASGAYSIPGLPVGQHSVNVSVDGAVANSTSAVIQDNQTTTLDFALAEGEFTVAFRNSVEAVAGETQSFDVEVQNVGDIITTQTVELDWGNGAFTDSVSVELAGGDTAVETLSVTTASDQSLGFYDVTVSSDDDTDTVNATIAPERTFNQTFVQPGDTVEVTVNGTVGQPADVSLAEKWDQAAASQVTEVSSTFTVDIEFPGTGETAVVFNPGQQGFFEYVYQVDIPADAGSDFDWQPLAGGSIDDIAHACKS